MTTIKEKKINSGYGRTEQESASPKKGNEQSQAAQNLPLVESDIYQRVETAPVALSVPRSTGIGEMPQPPGETLSAAALASEEAKRANLRKAGFLDTEALAAHLFEEIRSHIENAKASAKGLTTENLHEKGHNVLIGGRIDKYNENSEKMNEAVNVHAGVQVCESVDAHTHKESVPVQQVNILPAIKEANRLLQGQGIQIVSYTHDYGSLNVGVSVPGLPEKQSTPYD